MNEEPVHPRALFEAVFQFPAMYTLTGTYEEAVSFLEGYYSGIARSNPYAESVALWNSFRSALEREVQAENSKEAFLKFRSSKDNASACQSMVMFIETFLRKEYR